ncbi:DUF1338 domain-containing protein [Planctomicrobium sp. SH661]|uniref:DUF1338 domain-containing protein n=1 Tax=Planctomicrobium sp. SH661 TaxID=3448124 RepID=UPI003F5B7287
MATSELNNLLEKLWTDFTAINPQAEAIHRLLEERGETVVNDHIAFRTFADPRVGVEIIERPFVAGGYEKKEEYRFEQKKLVARHYEHADPALPKIFISELRVCDFSCDMQRVVKELLDEIPAQLLDDPWLCASGRPWNLPIKTYEALAAESEYAGWLAAFGFRANHFTVLVNSLKTVQSLAELNDIIRQAGFPLNEEGGEIKGSPEDRLEQSSTLASQVEATFADGTLVIPGCYYEFARRYEMPDGNLFGGFVPKSADKIFHSTDRRTVDMK